MLSRRAAAMRSAFEAPTFVHVENVLGNKRYAQMSADDAALVQRAFEFFSQPGVLHHTVAGYGTFLGHGCVEEEHVIGESYVEWLLGLSPVGVDKKQRYGLACVCLSTVGGVVVGACCYTLLPRGFAHGASTAALQQSIAARQHETVVIDLICATRLGAPLLREVQARARGTYNTRNAQLHSMNVTYATSQKACLSMQAELEETRGPVTREVAGVRSNLDNFYRHQGFMSVDNGEEDEGESAGWPMERNIP